MTRWVVFAFWSVVLVGLPFWWKTTEVYRANLPFAEIDAWQTKQVLLLLKKKRDFMINCTYIGMQFHHAHNIHHLYTNHLHHG